MKIFNFINSVNFKKNKDQKSYEKIGNIEEFEKKHNIDKRTIEYCKEYLEEWEESNKEDFDKKFGGIDKIEFEKKPSVISNDYMSCQVLISNLTLLKQKQAILNYSVSFDSKGQEFDGWISEIE